MRRFCITAVGWFALLAMVSTVSAQPTKRPARIGMLCATSCTGGNYPALWDELRKLGSIWLSRRYAELNKVPSRGRATPLWASLVEFRGGGPFVGSYARPASPPLRFREEHQGDGSRGATRD